jgi:hypothetical protein
MSGGVQGWTPPLQFNKEEIQNVHEIHSISCGPGSHSQCHRKQRGWARRWRRANHGAPPSVSAQNLQLPPAPESQPLDIWALLLALVA